MKKNISTQRSITRQHPPRAMYIPDHQAQQQQQQQPEQTMSEEMVQAMLRSFMYSAIVAGSVAVIAALAYCAVQLTSRDRNGRLFYNSFPLYRSNLQAHYGLQACIIFVNVPVHISMS